jgi:5-methylcytosine-specific restriction endonuclease McrA
MYVLESDQQLPIHDRKIDDTVRRAVLVRDNHTCQSCGWSHQQWNPSDPRHLELHHIEHHVSGGTNQEENLETLCNICHDQKHR